MADTAMRGATSPHHSKVFYRPIEAAIRWTGVVKFEARILERLGVKRIPDPEDFPRWPMLRLNTERIFDALWNGDLAYGKAGITSDDSSLLDDPELTVRHVDLKSWMHHAYPDQKPDFLFDEVERQIHPAISIETIQALMVEREALKIRLAARDRSFNVLHEKHQSLSEQAKQWTAAEREVSARSESTYLNIVGGLLTLMFGKSPGGTPYSAFETMESLISTLLAHYEGRPGISERTLWAKFTAAKRHLESDVR